MTEYTVSYLLESFRKAAWHLATGKGDARERVWLAYLAIHHFQSEHLPENLRKDLEWVFQELTTRDPKRNEVVRDSKVYEEGLIEANLRTMKNRTASNIAERIYAMYQKILGMAFEPREGTR